MRALALMLLLLLLPGAAFAEGGEATQRMREANARLQELLAHDVAPRSEAEKQLVDALTREIRLLFDVRDLARRALVDHWDEMRPADRDEVVELVRRLAERSYVRSLRAHLRYEVRYAAEEPRPGGAVLVRTVVKAETKGRPADVALDYLMEKTAAGWRVLDVITDEASMLKSYRGQFNKIIVREGVPALLARMRRRLDDDVDEGD